MFYTKYNPYDIRITMNIIEIKELHGLLGKSLIQTSKDL
jgi:hypothetical protein